MKKLLSLIATIIVISSCQTESKHDVLLHITHSNKLKLRYMDGKCGEWGGNVQELIIYRDEFESPLLADYSEKTKICGSYSELKDSISIKRIKINEEESNLIIESINELCKSKMSREKVPPHGGILYHFMLSDSSMIIRDFPSVELKNFAALVEKIKQK